MNAKQSLFTTSISTQTKIIPQVTIGKQLLSGYDMNAKSTARIYQVNQPKAVVGQRMTGMGMSQQTNDININDFQTQRYTTSGFSKVSHMNITSTVPKAISMNLNALKNINTLNSIAHKSKIVKSKRSGSLKMSSITQKDVQKTKINSDEFIKVFGNSIEIKVDHYKKYFEDPMQALRRLIHKYGVNDNDEVQIKPLSYKFDELQPVFPQKLVNSQLTKYEEQIKYLNNFIKYAKGAIECDDQDKLDGLMQIIQQIGKSHQMNRFFWESLVPQKSDLTKVPEDDQKLTLLIQKSFGSYEDFMKLFSKQASEIDGEGRCWLAYNTLMDELRIQTAPMSAKIDNRFPHLLPIFMVEVWYPAIYDYDNCKREKVLEDIWKITNWELINQRFKMVTDFDNDERKNIDTFQYYRD